ncbi:MAG: CARDB domain-containing protein [Methanosarcina mazei]
MQAFDKNLDKVSEGTSDENGKVTLSIREYTQTSGAKTSANPYKITASKEGFPDGSIESYVTASKNDTVLMGQGEFTSDLPLTINGDWDINNTQSYADKTIYLKGNLVVQNGGSLTLDNVTLLIQLLGAEQFGINVQKGGEMSVKNSFLSPAYTGLGFYYPFNVYGLLNMDNSTVKMATSIYFDSTSDKNSTIIDSIILRNRDYGLNLQSNPKISSNLLQYNGNGIRVYSSSINVSDTTIEGSSQYDYYIYRNSKINSINTSFDKSKVYLYDSNSILDNFWYLTVNAVDANGNPISNSNIYVDNSTGSQIYSGSTDSQGLVKNIAVKEYRRTTTDTTNYNPHKISATFDNVTAQTSVNVDSNKEVTLSLNVNQPLKITILEPANNSIFVQNDPISFNALGFDPEDSVLKGSAIDWISSLDGPIGSGESFISSDLSLGTHQITAKATNSRGESVNDSVNIQVIGRSDLTIDGINWSPTKINEGEVVTFNASIRNIGNGYSLTPFYVRFLVDNQYIGQKRIDRLNASESTVITQQWTAKAYAKNVTVIADYYNNIGEIDETNNIFITSLNEVKQADLVVSNLTWTPETFHDGTPVIFKAEIRNLGIGNASKPFDVGFYINESKIGTVTVNDSLLAGESKAISTTWNAVPGTYVLTVKADETNTILESEESNNIGSTPLTPIYQPDLQISNVTVPPTIDDGSIVSFNATVENFGLNSTENWFGVRFYVDGNDLGYSVIEGLTTGGNSTVSKSWTATPGSHVLTVKADSDGWYSNPYNAYGPRVNESNETNNNFTLTLPKVEQSDLVVSNLTWVPENFSTGDSVTFEAYIENIGNGSTLRTFNTGFIINGNTAGIKSVPGLIKSGSAKVSQVWTATSGDHNVSVKVDYNGQINESNESNNLLFTNLSYTEEKYLLTVSSDSSSYGENGTAIFTAKASSLASPNVYLKDTDVNITLTILDENNSTVYTVPMSYTTAGFIASIDLTGYPKGNYVARVTLRDNNWSTAEKTIQFKITENFNVSISTDKSIYDREEIVHITGRAQYSDGSPVVDTPALLDIKLKGYTQTFSLVTDSNGNLSYNFKPGSYEAGNFTARLSVNSNRLWISADTSFNIYGLYMTPSGTVDYEMSKNSSENVTFTLRNYGETVLHGINVQLDGDAIPGVETQLLQAPPDTLTAGSQGSFIIKISSSNVDVSKANYTVRVSTTEGSYEEAKLVVNLVDSKPAAIVSPTSIAVGINPNNNMVKTVTISNAGYEFMNDINISKPSLDWISVSSANLGNISPGMNKSFSIFLNPGNNTSVGVYQETITISSSNHQPVNIYLKISVTSSEKGDLMFHVTNDIGQNISGASVTIQNPAVLTEIFKGTTDENGYYIFNNISVGTYNYFVTASGHTSVSGSSTVSPGIQTLEEPVLSKDVLSAQLTVTPVQITDDYDILLNLTFETEVPPPLLVPNPIYLRYGMNFSDPVYENDSFITISNPGLVSISNVTIDSSSLQGVNITFPTGHTFFVDELKAQSSINIPYHLNVTYVACGSDTYRNSIRIRGDYLTFEENSDVTRKVYLSSELPVFVNMYNCPVNTGPVSSTIEEYFKHDYKSPGGSYSSGFGGDSSIPQVETIHERVKFNIPQDATLERDAFAASLELTNKLTDQNIENVRVNLEIKDENGNDASSLFFVNLTSLNSINSIDGSGVISPSAIADANWLLVPEYNAGGTSASGKDYTVQAFINYTVNGVSFSTNSTEESITVMPQPLLNLTYTIPGEVKADTPFNLTLNVTNVGYGIAKSLKLDSAQPVIYENKAGLLVSLKLIGSGLVGGPETDSMLIDFGDLAPGESKEAYWIMTSSLDGEFTEFKGSFSHSNALGGAETSLIKDINYIIKMSAPIADFTSNVTSGYTPLSVKFTDLSKDATGWKWEFGDGNTSKEQNPIYTYSTTGTYTVNLTVTNTGGSNATTKSNYISVGYIPPTTNPVIVTNKDSFTPTFSWTYYARGDSQQQYQLEVWTESGGKGTNEWSIQGTGTNTSVTYAGNSLVSDKWYFVRVRAFDGYSWSEWSETSWRPFGQLIDKVERQIALMASSDPMKYYDAKEASKYMNTIGILKKEEYDAYIKNIGIYRGLQSQMLQRALYYAEKGDVTRVDKYLTIANYDSENALISFQNAVNLYISVLNNGIYVAKEIREFSWIALESGIKVYSPGGAIAAEVLLGAIDYSVDSTIDPVQAKEDAATKILFAVFNKIPFPEFGGKTIEEALQDREIMKATGDNIFPLIQKATNNYEDSRQIYEALKYALPGISEETAGMLWDGMNSLLNSGLDSALKYQQIIIKSPGELRVYDSGGNVTGLVNGEIVQDIPNSVYDAENKSVIILGSDDTYRYDVVGTGTGEYGLELLSVNGTDYNTVFLQNTVVPNQVHQYTVDWNSVATEKMVALDIDSDGDGTFDKSIQMQLPTASFVNTHLTNQQISFDGSSSEGNNIVLYNWDFGDGTSGDGQTIDHIYAYEGDYDVTLVVKNNNGGMDRKTKNIRIDLTSPTTTANISGTLGYDNWYTSDVLVNLTATDGINGTGINKTEYSFDNASWNTYNAPFNISNNGSTILYYHSTDNAGNVELTKNETIKIEGVEQDLIPPTIQSVILFPADTVTGSLINVTVNATDNIGVSSVQANDIPLLNQEGNLWNGSITTLEGTHSVNVSAVDESGNVAWNNSTTYTALTPDNLPPSSITNLQSTSGNTWINWTWQNPTDPDFNHTEIYLNNVFQTSTSTEFYNAIGLEPETSYTIGIRTADIYGNLNETWVNSTATTGKESVSDDEKPVIESVVLLPIDATAGSIINISANITDNIGVVEVVAGDVQLTKVGNDWNGSIIAPSFVGDYSLNITAKDAAGNTVETTVMYHVIPPQSISDIQFSTGPSWINFTWTKPVDVAFNHVEIYLNDTFQKNTSDEYFNATGLQPATDYTIGTRTADAYGNVNETWVNVTATTVAELASDVEKPVIGSVFMFPANATAGATINLSINATDNIDVTGVTAGDVQLIKTNDTWNGSIIAPASIGNYSLLITAKDAAGNTAETTKNYRVVTPTGSLGVGVSPKTTTAPTSGKTIDYTVKIKSIQNFDDIVRVNVTMDGLPASYQIPLDLFEWNNQTINIPSNSTVSLPLKLTIPSGQTAGRKAFKVRANSTLWITSAYDSGVITIS